MDEYQRPLYGDPFGVLSAQEEQTAEHVDRDLWGTLEPEVEGAQATMTNPRNCTS